MTDQQIENTFTYHKPFGDQPERYEKIRAKAKEFAKVLQENCCPSRELSCAFTDLQRCVQMANASIAINEAYHGLVGAEAKVQ
jgi:hypothetical protein